MNSIHKNQLQRMSLKITSDVVLTEAEETTKDSGKMKTLFKEARFIRMCILSSNQWHFQESVDTTKHSKIILLELEFFYKWCITESNVSKNARIDIEQVAQEASVLSQSFCMNV